MAQKDLLRQDLGKSEEANKIGPLTFYEKIWLRQDFVKESVTPRLGPSHIKKILLRQDLEASAPSQHGGRRMG